MITNIHVELNFQISFLFPQPALLRAVICKKGVLCSRPRIKFIHVTFKSILTWEGNNRIVGGCSPEQQGPTSEGLTLLGEPCLTLSVIITQMWLQKLWSVTFLSRFTVSVCGVQRYIFVFFSQTEEVQDSRPMFILTVFCSMQRNVQARYVANYICVL